jgi:hypothetical protein
LMKLDLVMFCHFLRTSKISVPSHLIDYFFVTNKSTNQM